MAPPSQGRGSSVGPQMTQKTLLGFMKKKDDGETRFSISSPAAPTTAAVIATSISTRAAESRASNSTPFKPFVPTMATVAQTPCAVKTWSSAGNQSSAPGRSSARRSAPSNIAEPIDVDMLDDDEVTVPKLTRLKRKSELEHDDEHSLNASSPVTGRLASSPATTTVSKRRTKRPPPSFMGMDEEEDEEDDVRPIAARNKAKGRKSVVVVDDDDDSDFIAPSGEESDIQILYDTLAPRGNKVTRTRRKTTNEASKSKSKPKPKSKSKTSNTAAAGSASASERITSTKGMTLTKSARRVLGKEVSKKANDDGYWFLKDIEDKDGHKPSDAEFNPRTIQIPSSAWSSFTAFQKQFWEIKKNQFDTVLFFESGAIFELYENDAWIGHQEFNLKLVDRVNMCVVGIPDSSFSFWAGKFISKGYKVGKVTHGETAQGVAGRLAGGKAKGGSVTTDGRTEGRALNQVMKTNTLAGSDLETGDDTGHCVAVIERSDNTFGVCVRDFASGQSKLCAFVDDMHRVKLETIIRRVRARELIHIEGNLGEATTQMLQRALPESCQWKPQHEREVLTYEGTRETLRAIFPPPEDAMDDEEYAGVPAAIHEMLDEPEAIRALGLTITHLHQLNIESDGRSKALEGETQKSPASLDGLGCTSNLDGMAIADAVLHEIATHAQALSSFATYYLSLGGNSAFHPEKRDNIKTTDVDRFTSLLSDSVAKMLFGAHVGGVTNMHKEIPDPATVVSSEMVARFKEKFDSKMRNGLPLPGQTDW